jgi:hypothetical protein
MASINLRPDQFLNINEYRRGSRATTEMECEALREGVSLRGYCRCDWNNRSGRYAWYINDKRSKKIDVAQVLSAS